jgi:signal transduction histidine kinase
MTLRRKLTLGSMLLATLVVGLISAVDLANVMQLEFDATLKRADLLADIATDYVTQALNRRGTAPLREALQDPELARRLVSVMTASDAITEVAAVDPDWLVLADSHAGRVGLRSPPNPDFRPLVTATNWYGKLRVLMRRDTGFYQLERKLGAAGVTLLYVRVIIDPAFIRGHIIPTLRQNSYIALASVLGAVLLTFLFSAVAFRPLGQIGRMLDLVARGEYEPGPGGTPPAKPATDELSIMASKVSLLGQRMRDASELRGNIDRLLQDLEDAVFIFNRERRLVFASGSVERFLGRERADLAGQPVAGVFPPSTTLGLLVSQAVLAGRSFRNRRVPGQTPAVLLSVDLLENSGLLVRLRDPEAQRKIGRELETADRLAAISKVSGGVAHEVKNPLNAILLHVEVARARLAQGQTDVAPQMEIISREILRIDRVVKTFLDFTRPVELKLTNVALPELVEEIAGLARPQADASKIRVVVRQEAEGAEVRVDRDLLKQAVLNVVVNAIEAMPEGGELRLESLATGDTAEIRVSDTGPGIPPEARDKIFLLYFTTKKAGSGIGLAMTFRIVQLHNGTIDFASEPGKGTTFSIRLPVA